MYVYDFLPFGHSVCQDADQRVRKREGKSTLNDLRPPFSDIRPGNNSQLFNTEQGLFARNIRLQFYLFLHAEKTTT